MKITTALYETLLETDRSITTDFELFKKYVEIKQNGSFRGKKLRFRDKVPSMKQYNRLRSQMLKERMLRHYPGFSKSVYLVSNTSKSSIQDACCIVDPFCYVSHFSALQRYMLTNRNPKAMIFTTGNRQTWNALKKEKINQELEEGIEREIAAKLFLKYAFGDKIKGQIISRHSTSSLKDTIYIRDSDTRIAKIGEVFVDTLERPQWCGGIQHVLDVWEKHAEKYLSEIIYSVNKSERKIVKVRAGYILDEMLKIKNEEINNWVIYAERGSSRKLNPEEKYMPVFSEKWMLSINV